MTHTPTAPEIEAAHQRIAPYINQTPLLSSDFINQLAGCKVWFKCENLQKIGAFKARGGLNAVLSLPEAAQKKGITTHSSGNHAQAIALAARTVGTKAYVVMPSNAPQIKKDGVAALGGEIIFCEPNLAAREATVQQVQTDTRATFIHPFDNAEVVAGQATVAKEMLQQQPALQCILTPVGGGGLLSGTCLSATYFGHNIAVWGCEPEGAADAILSFQSGQVEKAPYIKTIADGLLTNLSASTLAIIRSHAKGILLVSEEEIVAAMHLIFNHLKVVVEPSGAVSLAALLRHKEQFAQQEVALVISGGNVDLSALPFA